MELFKMTSCQYVAIQQQLMTLGFNDPSSDTDERQRKAWDYIVENDLTLEIKTNYDFQNNIAPQSAKEYPRFQSRDEGEKQTRVESLYEKFYELEEQQIRIIFGFELSDGKLYIPIGNHRAKSHLKAQKNGLDSKGHVLIIGNNLTDIEKVFHGFKLAVVGNADEKNQTAEETEGDILHQLKQAWQIETEMNNDCSDWTEEEKIEWGKKWTRDNKPNYKAESKKVRLGRLVNSVFSSSRGQSIDYPERCDVNTNFKSFWPRSNWDPENQKTIKQLAIASHSQSCDTKLYGMWSNRTNVSQVRQKVWLAVRCGQKLDTAVTSIEGLAKQRTNFLEHIKKFNINENHILGGCPVIEKILFVKQLSGNDDDYQAYEWNEQTEEYDKIEKVP